MDQVRLVLYVGHETQTQHVLARHLLPPDYRLECVSLNEATARIQATWQTVVLLETDLALPDGGDRLALLRRVDARVPLIVLAPGNSLPQTQADVARSHGAEALFLLPLTDAEAVKQAIDKAFQQLQSWRARFPQMQSR